MLSIGIYYFHSTEFSFFFECMCLHVFEYHLESNILNENFIHLFGYGDILKNYKNTVLHKKNVT